MNQKDVDYLRVSKILSDCGIDARASEISAVVQLIAAVRKDTLDELRCSHGYLRHECVDLYCWKNNAVRVDAERETIDKVVKWLRTPDMTDGWGQSRSIAKQLERGDWKE